jgi:hypothetical protein
MAKKRTKADKLQRQTEQLERKADRRPDEIEWQKAVNSAVVLSVAESKGKRHCPVR